MEEALNDVRSIGMVVDETAVNIFDIKINADPEENLENYDDEMDESVEEGENIESEKVMEQIFFKNDLHLQTINEENDTTKDNMKDIDLKDYSEINVDLSENSIYLKISLSKQKSIVIKKSSYCWLLDEGNGRISTDRLKRFVTGKNSGKRKTLGKNTGAKAKKSKKNKTLPRMKEKKMSIAAK